MYLSDAQRDWGNLVIDILKAIRDLKFLAESSERRPSDFAQGQASGYRCAARYLEDSLRLAVAEADRRGNRDLIPTL